jgi:hypothetical protein
MAALFSASSKGFGLSIFLISPSEFLYIFLILLKSFYNVIESIFLSCWGCQTRQRRGTIDAAQFIQIRLERGATPFIIGVLS